jgi:uncharacterized membrane protein YeaQ/YmgE (transglycosylase-associated protein family)
MLRRPCRTIDETPIVGYVLFPFVVLAVMGLIPGVMARLLVPGRQRMGCMATWLLGFGGLILFGSLAGSVTSAIMGPRRNDWWTVVGGLIGSTVGAVLILLAYRAYRRRRPTVIER